MREQRARRAAWKPTLTGSGEQPSPGILPTPVLEGRRGGERAAAVPLALVTAAALLLLSLALFDRPLIRGDAVAYFMWTASISRDLDMDLANQAERFGPLNTYMAFFNVETGHWASVFAWGQGLVLLPAFWAARALDQLPFMRINDAWFHDLQAYPFAYSLAGMLQVNGLTVGSLALVYAAGRRLGVPGWAAAGAGLAAVWGTPLYYYSTIQPLYSHATATFVHTLAIFLFIRADAALETSARKDVGPPWPWLLAGAAFGLAALTRWQLALSAGLFTLLLAGRRQWRAALLLIAGFAAVAWHIPYTWNWMFGSPVAVPMDAAGGEGGFFSWPRHLRAVLFSGDRGLFVWSPIVALGLAGLAALPRNHWPLAGVLAGVAAAQVLAAAGVRDWYAGESFGMRRLTEIYPAAALGASALLAAAGRAWRGGGPARRLPAALVFAVLGACVVYGWLLIVGHPLFGYFTDPSFGYVAEPPPATALNTLRFLLVPSKLHLIWPMMEHHFGPWAWTWPGP
jgi:hypothetical protein